MNTLILKEKIHKLVDASDNIDVLERVEEFLEETKQDYVLPEHIQQLVLSRLNDPNATYRNARESLDELKKKFNLEMN